MVKNMMKSLALAGLLAMAAVPITAGAEGKADPPAFQVQMSGAIAIPGLEAENGIILGGSCTPDVHTFDKGKLSPVPEHIVFAVHVDPKEKNPKAVNHFNVNLEDVKVNVLIYGSGKHPIATIPLNLTPQEELDPNTKTRFFVQCVFLAGPNKMDLPTGDYTYKFEASPKSGNPKREWVPSNNTFTIIDSSQH
jgi:hypothetical protein